MHAVFASRAHHGKNALGLEQLLCLRARLPNATDVPAREVLLVRGSWMLVKGPNDDAFSEAALSSVPWCQFLRKFSLVAAGSETPSGGGRAEYVQADVDVQADGV